MAATARQALEKSVDALPGDVTARLAAARKNALGEAVKPTVTASWHFNHRYTWGMAASILLVCFIGLFALSILGNKDIKVNNEPVIVADDPDSENGVIAAAPVGAPNAVQSAEDLLTVIELTRLAPESEALLEDLEFFYWLGLNEQTLDEDV